MKCKTDFVTNSSSASIILMIKSDCEDIEKFREIFNKYIEMYKSGTWSSPLPIHFWDGSNIVKIRNEFQVIEWTSMFNCVMDDVPHYMQTLYLEWSVEPKDIEKQFGFKKIKIKVRDEH